MARMLSRRSTVGLLLARIAAAAEPLNYTYPSEQCISQAGYSSCIQPINLQAESCEAQSNGDTNQITACAIVGTEGSLGCVFEGCWNVAYSCESQILTGLVLQNAIDPQNIPYYPAEDNAPGGCSCNIGDMQVTVLESLGPSYSNCTNAGGDLNACTCCAQAGAYAGLYDICPDVSVDNLCNTLSGTCDLLAVYDPPFSECASILSATPCEASLGFPALTKSLTYLTNVPATTGTGMYSDLPGQLTTPIAAVVTYVPQTAYTIVITAADVDSDNGGGGGGESSGGEGGSNPTSDGGSSPTSAATATTGNGGSQGGSNSQTGTAAAAASTTKKSAGLRMSAQWPMVVGVLSATMVTLVAAW